MITQERLKELLNYDPETGIFSWAVSTTYGVVAGRRAGGKYAVGYRYLSVDKRRYYEHRLAWLYVYGKWPEHEIDHIDGVRDNNAIRNLRDLTHAQNCQNIRKTGKSSGLLGAHFSKKMDCWTANIRVDGKVFYLGVFDTEEEAHAAYLAKKREIHPFGEIARAA